MTNCSLLTSLVKINPLTLNRLPRKLVHVESDLFGKYSLNEVIFLTISENLLNIPQNKCPQFVSIPNLASAKHIGHVLSVLTCRLVLAELEVGCCIFCNRDRVSATAVAL